MGSAGTGFYGGGMVGVTFSKYLPSLDIIF